MEELLQKIEKAWGRKTLSYSSTIYALLAEEALTGFFLLQADPVIGKFNDQVCVLVNLEDWIAIKRVADETATPFRIVAQGQKMIAHGFLPHIGLTYAVREAHGVLMVHIPVEECTVVG